LESHEITGRISRVLDEDLSQNIQKLVQVNTISFLKKKNENTWVMLNFY
jgi:hypothetical protein